MHPVILRFLDPVMEARFRARYIDDNLSFIRVAVVLGIAVWIVFGLLAGLVLGGDDRTADLVLRYGFAVPLGVIGLVATWAPYRRWWYVVIVALSGLVWSMHRIFVEGASPGWAYAGIMTILAFIYTLSRLRFVHAAIVGAVVITVHNAISIVVLGDRGDALYFANFFVISLWVMGMVASFGLERFTRLLFLRERELDAERGRADRLLLNTLPHAVVARLKERQESPSETYLAEALPEVSVIFADLVGFTEHVERMAPEALMMTLDDVFTRFDMIASRLGLEKIKTVGDAYMVVAGAPEPREDHAEAAAEMALAMLGALTGSEWPDGQPMQVRIGVATGPAVAGVIGRERFAYDLWGDTVNLASRLEANGEPGRILVAEGIYAALAGQYRFSDPCTVDLKGKGPTAARFLRGRLDTVVS